MQSYQYIPLSSWLGNADVLYLDARVLWLQISGMGGGLILMWLAIEQLMKVIIFQERIKNNELESKNADDVFIEIGRWGKKMNHKLPNILSELDKYYPNLFTPTEKIALE